MRPSEYVERLQNMDQEYLAQWIKLGADLREQGQEFRAIDPKMTFLMQGLAVQIDRYLAHIGEKQAEINRAIEIEKNAEPIDSSPEINGD